MAAAVHAPTASSARDRKRLRDYWLLAVAGCIIGATVLAAFDYSFFTSLLALALLAQCLYPAFRYRVGDEAVIPAFPILAGAFAIQFSLPVFVGERGLYLFNGYQSLGDDSIAAALLVANAAFAVFLLLVYSRQAGVVISKLPVFRFNLNRTRAVIFSVFFGIAGLAISRLSSELGGEAVTQYGALIRVVKNQLLVAIGVLAWLRYTSNQIWLTVLYFGLIGVAVVDGLSSGFLEFALIPIGIYFAFEWIYRHRINKLLVVGLVAAMLLLNPVKGEFRERAWFSDEASASMVDKAVLWLSAGTRYWGQVLTGESSSHEAAVGLARRTSMIDVLAHVYETSPAERPYLMGESYKYFLYSFIPRAIWPEKPMATANRMMAVEYGLTTVEGAERTTFGLSLVGEGYANFGVLGSVLIMTILAIVLRSLQHMFASRESGPGGHALFMAFFIFFLNGLGTSAEIMFGNLLQSLLVSGLLIYWVSEKRPRHAA